MLWRAPSLSPIRAITSPGGPTKLDASRGDRAREARILGEKAVAGMDRLRAYPSCAPRDDAARRRGSLRAASGRAERDGDVGQLHVQRASRSASEYTATLRIPSSRHARITRTAISPRFATSRVSRTTGFIARALDLRLPRTRLHVLHAGFTTCGRRRSASGAIGARAVAASASPSAARDSTGSRMPSSHEPRGGVAGVALALESARGSAP